MSASLHRVLWLACLALGLTLAGCGSKPLTRAPVEDRGIVLVPAAPVADARTLQVKQPPGFENAGKPGYYTVKPGDTLIRIGLEYGQSHRDLARWNALENANRIEVGQVLRVVPPLTAAEISAASASAASAGTPVVVAKPVSGGTVAPAPLGTDSAQAVPADATPAPAQSASAPASEDDLGWIWPSNGSVIAGFDEVKNKGLDISGTAGEAVLASADGRVVYAGNGLRGYGNLIILKHNSTYLTAYAHNQTLLVKEDQTVKKGAKIAEMGSTDADRVKLHFEVRKQGKPVDPAKYLPAR